MSVANFSRWPNVSLAKNSEYQRKNSSQASLVSSVSDLSLNEDADSSKVTTAGDFGTLIIVVMKAKNLYNRRAISKQNPYCSVRVANHSDRTKVITRGGQAPIWDHEVRFKLNKDDDNRQLKLCVFDQNGSSTEIIGDALIPLKPAFDAPVTQGYDNWFPIHFNKRYVGEVYLEMTFYPRRKSSSKRSSRRSSAMSFTQPQSSLGHISPSASNHSMLNASLAGQASNYSSEQQQPSASNPLQGSPKHSSHHTLPPVPPIPPLPPHYPSLSSLKHSESMPILSETPSRSPSPPTPAARRSPRPLPKIPTLQDPPFTHVSAQEDIQRQINDGYEASLFERLKPRK